MRRGFTEGRGMQGNFSIGIHNFDQFSIVFAQFDSRKLQAPAREQIAENEFFLIYSLGKTTTALLHWMSNSVRKLLRTAWKKSAIYSTKQYTQGVEWTDSLSCQCVFCLVSRFWFKGLVAGCQSGSADEGARC